MNNKINDNGDSISLDASVGTLLGGATSITAGKIAASISSGSSALKSVWVPGAVSAVGVLTGGVVSGLAGALTRRYSKTDNGKAIGLGLGVGGAFGTLLGVSGIMLGASFLAKASAILGATALYGFLYFLISGDLTGARSKLEENTDKNTSDELMKELQEKIDTKTIRV